MTHLASLRARLNHPGRNIPRPHRELPEWPGTLREGPRGRYFLIEEYYDGAHRHGGRALQDLLNQSLDPDWAPELPSGVALDRMAFLDTETTGLAGGAGTMAFLIGVASYTGDGLRLRQYFLLDPSGEAQMLEDVLAEVAASSALVTFNGRQFDVPVMQARSILRLRRMRALEGIPHWDLLPHARRLWRGRTESCALSALEASVLGVHRSAEDVPGWAIPTLYREFLAGGEEEPMERVLYHNRQDILSMVTLATELMSLYSLRTDEIQDAGDALAMARVFHARGAMDRAEALYRAVLCANAEGEEALAGLARLLKHSGRGREAVPLWEEWAKRRADAWEPRVELSKHYEWRERDYGLAVRWAEEAESAALAGRSEQKRLDRLARKRSRVLAAASNPVAA